VLVESTVPELASTIRSCSFSTDIALPAVTHHSFVAPAVMISRHAQKEASPPTARKGAKCPAAFIRAHCLTLRVHGAG
jgi:hypothetical protein